MESNCNNRNTMNCAHNHMMRSCDGQATRCNPMVQKRDCTMQRCGREQQIVQHTREDRMAQRRREEHVECCGRMVNPSDTHHCHPHTNVSVECVCQVTREKDCHRPDEMEHLGCEFPVVMAYVPWQQWGDMYEAECGLMQGTIFKDLNFIFCGERC